MRTRIRPLVIGPIAVALALVLGPGPAPTRAADEKPGTVHAKIAGFEHDRGAALVGLYRSKRGFPNEAKHAFARKELRIRSGRVEVEFHDVPPGPFAVTVMHDEDGDYEMDTGLFGIPEEGYGVSRDAVRRFGPPRFEDAVLRLAPGGRKSIRIPVHY